MNWKNEWKALAGIAGVFAICFWLPVGWERFTGGIMEALHLVKWYAREHVLLCLVPAFFIAGAIGVFISQASVMKYLGAKANKALAYGVAAVSGSILAVCSCTVLPLFAGIYRMGAGLGPACAFLYSGPAINVLAIILTARILGPELGVARAVGAISFSVIIGLIMHFIYRKEELAKADVQASLPEPEVTRPLWKNAVFFFLMVAILVFANWGAPGDWEYRPAGGTPVLVDIIEAPFDTAAPEAVFVLRSRGATDAESAKMQVPATEFLRNRDPEPGIWASLWQHKWPVTAGFSVVFGLVLVFWFGLAWWKLLLAALPPLVLGLALPAGGLWVLLPFTAAVVGLAIALNTSSGENEEWFGATWTFAKQILPLLFFGVIIAGFLLGRPGYPGLIPARFVEMLVGASPRRMLEITGWGGGGFEAFATAVWPFWTNFFASVFGAFMYFATLTEVPILQGLIGAGMGKGPALALLLAGPALSLPNMLVIRSIMGTGKTVVFVSLVIIMATVTGMIFGAFYQ